MSTVETLPQLSKPSAGLPVSPAVAEQAPTPITPEIYLPAPESPREATMRALTKELEEGNDQADLPGVALGTAEEGVSTPTAVLVVDGSMEAEIPRGGVNAETVSTVVLASEEHATVETLRQLEDFISQPPVTRGLNDGTVEADGIYISPEALPAEQASETLPQVTEAKIMPGAQLGSGDSHHGVAFSKVLLRYGEGEVTKDVAIKAFAGASFAQREYDALQAARDRGFDTYKPLGLARNGNTTYLITEYRDDVTTQDNVDWTIEPSDTEKYEAEIAPSLRFMMTGLAERHAAGIFDGDAQPKNFAKTDGGKAVVMDLESAQISGSDEEHILLLTGGDSVKDSAAYQDVAHFWYALTRQLSPDTNVFLQNADQQEYKAELKKCLDLYVAALREHASPELLEHFDEATFVDAIYNNPALA